MKYYILHPHTIKSHNETWSFMTSEDGLKIGNRIELFYNKFIQPFYAVSGVRPDFNPCKNVEFILEKNRKDIYRISGKLNRHFIVSEGFHNILMGLNLSAHVSFTGIVLKNKNEVIDNYYYFHFYESMWDIVDFPRSRFKYIKNFTWDLLRYVKFKSADEYEYAKSSVQKGETLVFDEIAIPDINKYDCFMILKYSHIKFILSEKLVTKIKDNNIKADFNELTEFKIIS